MKCNHCLQEKKEINFRRIGLTSSMCKECDKDKKHRHYKKKSEYYKKCRSDYYYGVEMGVDPELGRQRAKLKRKIATRKKLLKAILKQESDFYKNKLLINKLKKCSGCKEEKSVNDFSSSQYRCKPCSSKAVMKSRDKRLKKDPLFKFQERCRIATNYAFKRKNYTKASTTYNLLGCSWETLQQRFEDMFDSGMSWQNLGKWHIDHIIPISSAKTKEDVVRLCHYTNLQPLWAADNLSKSNKLDWEKPTINIL